MLTHGFTQDEHGRKMSKSLGNTIEPQAVIKQSGADILRLWVAACDYTDDQRIGPEILKNTVETYRKLRNTIRWMLGTLHHFKPGEKVARDEMPELERLMLHQLAEQDAIVRKAYAEFDYKTVVAALSAFMNSELSAFYFDIRKDTLYCDPPSSLARKAALTTIDMLCDAILKWLAPVLSFTCDEAWRDVPARRIAVGASVAFPEKLEAFRDDSAGREMGDHPQRPPRRHRRAGIRTRRQAHRFVAGGLADHLCVGQGDPGDVVRRRPRRSLHHLEL